MNTFKLDIVLKAFAELKILFSECTSRRQVVKKINCLIASELDYKKITPNLLKYMTMMDIFLFQQSEKSPEIDNLLITIRKSHNELLHIAWSLYKVQNED